MTAEMTAATAARQDHPPPETPASPSIFIVPARTAAQLRTTPVSPPAHRQQVPLPAPSPKPLPRIRHETPVSRHAAVPPGLPASSAVVSAVPDRVAHHVPATTAVTEEPEETLAAKAPPHRPEAPNRHLLTHRALPPAPLPLAIPVSQTTQMVH